MGVMYPPVKKKEGGREGGKEGRKKDAGSYQKLEDAKKDLSPEPLEGAHLNFN